MVIIIHKFIQVEKTKVVKNSANPNFNQTLTLKMSAVEVSSKTVVLQVFDQDTFSKDDPLGEAQLPLWTLDTNQVRK